MTIIYTLTISYTFKCFLHAYHYERLGPKMSEINHCRTVQTMFTTGLLMKDKERWVVLKQYTNTFTSWFKDYPGLEFLLLIPGFHGTDISSNNIWNHWLTRIFPTYKWPFHIVVSILSLRSVLPNVKNATCLHFILYKLWQFT